MAGFVNVGPFLLLQLSRTARDYSLPDQVSGIFRQQGKVYIYEIVSLQNDRTRRTQQGQAQASRACDP